MFMACAFWGLMAPLGKDAMTHGIDGIDMVTFRVVGGCLLFWLTAPFVKHERVPWQDRLRFAGAGLLGLVTNQCCYTIGLSLTSPINASIVTTSMPIFAMVLAALILNGVNLWLVAETLQQHLFKVFKRTTAVAHGEFLADKCIKPHPACTKEGMVVDCAIIEFVHLIVVEYLNRTLDVDGDG